MTITITSSSNAGQIRTTAHAIMNVLFLKSVEIANIIKNSNVTLTS